MLLEQLTLGIYHLRFYPDAKLQTAFHRFARQRLETVRQTFSIRLPVTKPCVIIDARILVAEPAVIEQEQLGADFLRRIVEADNTVKIKVKTGCFPVVQKHAARRVAIANPEVARPRMQLPAHVAQALRAKCPNHGRRHECFIGFEFVGRCKRIHAAHRANARAIPIEAKLEAARPSERPRQHPARVLLRWPVERNQEAWVAELMRPHADLGIQYLQARRELLGGHVRHLLRPIPGEVGEIGI